jgi:hypothetical protein
VNVQTTHDLDPKILAAKIREELLQHADRNSRSGRHGVNVGLA